MVFSFTALAGKARDELVNINADNVVGTDRSKVRFYGNTQINFRDYIIYTQEVQVQFIYVGNIRKIGRLIIPHSITLLNKNEPDEILIADGAEYERSNRAFVAKGHVRFKKEQSLVVVNELILRIADF